VANDALWGSIALPLALKENSETIVLMRTAKISFAILDKIRYFKALDFYYSKASKSASIAILFSFFLQM
jgi:hypothetical protein